MSIRVSQKQRAWYPPSSFRWNSITHSVSTALTLPPTRWATRERGPCGTMALMWRRWCSLAFCMSLVASLSWFAPLPRLAAAPTHKDAPAPPGTPACCCAPAMCRMACRPAHSQDAAKESASCLRRACGTEAPHASPAYPDKALLATPGAAPLPPATTDPAPRVLQTYLAGASLSPVPPSPPPRAC